MTDRVGVNHEARIIDFLIIAMQNWDEGKLAASIHLTFSERQACKLARTHETRGRRVPFNLQCIDSRKPCTKSMELIRRKVEEFTSKDGNRERKEEKEYVGYMN